METNKLTLVQKAEKVVAFKQKIYEQCSKQNLRKPTDEKISEYINAGYAMELSDFMHDYTHFEGVFRDCRHEPSPLEKETLEATLAMLSSAQLATLWNVYAQEAELGDEQLIYDIKKADKKHLATMVGSDKIERARFFQVGEDEVTIITDIAGYIVDQWPSIFDRILLYPFCYQFDYMEGVDYYTNVIAPIMIKLLGYNVEQGVNMVTYKKEK